MGACASDRSGDETHKKNCIILRGNINGRYDIEERLSAYKDESNPLLHIIYPYEENTTLLIYKEKVRLKAIKKCAEPFKAERPTIQESDCLIPADLVKSLKAQKKTILTSLKNIYGIEVYQQEDQKVYLHGISQRHLDIAMKYLKNISREQTTEGMVTCSGIATRKSDSHDNMLNSVSKTEFMALENLESGFQRLKGVQISWELNSILLNGPVELTTWIKTDLTSKLQILRSKQSEEIYLDKDEKKIVKDIMKEVRSEDTFCVYNEEMSQVVVYSDKQDDIRKFKHRLRYETGKVSGSVRNRKRFAENNQSLETCSKNFCSSNRSTKIKKQFSWSKDVIGLEIFYTKANIKVAVYKADILNVPVDCIVNAANDTLQHGGGVAKVIADAAGPKLIQEGDAIVRQQGRIQVGCQVTTSAGRLQYQCVIHTVGPCWSDYQPHDLQNVQKCEKDLYTAVYGCFTEAERRGLSTIAVPAVSSGIYAVPQEMCAVQYAKAVIDYSRNSRQGQALTEIHFIDRIPDLVKLMQDTFRTMIQKEHEPNYNIHNYVAFSSSIKQPIKETGRKRHELRETGRKGRENIDVSSSPINPRQQVTETGRKGRENIDVSSSPINQRQQVRETGRKGRENIDVSSSPTNQRQQITETGRKGHENIDVSSSPNNQRQIMETRRKGHDNINNAVNKGLYKTNESNKLCPFYYEPTVNSTKQFVFQVSEKPVVCIHEGDILKIEHIDAIVCPDDSKGSGMGKFASELEKYANYRQNKDTRFKQQKPSLGDLVLIDGKETPYNLIIHVVIKNIYSQRQELRPAILKSFDNILRLMKDCENVKTIAMPLFGVEQELLTERCWAELFLDRFAAFCCEFKNPSLEEVHIITHLSSSSAFSSVKEVFTEFADAFNRAPSHHKILPLRPPSPKVNRTCHEKDLASGQGHVSMNGEGDRDDNCAICMCPKTDPKTLSCGHSFCFECYTQMLNHKPVCAVCGKIMGIITGNQPDDGKMSVTNSTRSLAGYEGYGCIEITYEFPAGKQGLNHPSPGASYGGMRRTAYLPNTPEGKIVCRMLQLAFDRRLVFTISQSRTTGQEGLTWNDIHHKTNPNPGKQFGYPDPEYLRRVNDELAAKGITEADVSNETVV